MNRKSLLNKLKRHLLNDFEENFCQFLAISVFYLIFWIRKTIKNDCKLQLKCFTKNIIAEYININHKSKLGSSNLALILRTFWIFLGFKRIIWLISSFVSLFYLIVWGVKKESDYQQQKSLLIKIAFFMLGNKCVGHFYI